MLSRGLLISYTVCQIMLVCNFFSGVNPCAEVECRYGAECRVEGSGAVCACPPPCEPVLRPVCGSDARTHDSECELGRVACLLGRELRVVHAGACGKFTVTHLFL